MNAKIEKIEPLEAVWDTAPVMAGAVLPPDDLEEIWQIQEALQ